MEAWLLKTRSKCQTNSNEIKIYMKEAIDTKDFRVIATWIKVLQLPEKCLRAPPFISGANFGFSLYQNGAKCQRNICLSEKDRYSASKIRLQKSCSYLDEILKSPPTWVQNRVLSCWRPCIKIIQNNAKVKFLSDNQKTGYFVFQKDFLWLSLGLIYCKGSKSEFSLLTSPKIGLKWRFYPTSPLGGTWA